MPRARGGVSNPFFVIEILGKKLASLRTTGAGNKSEMWGVVKRPMKL